MGWPARRARRNLIRKALIVRGVSAVSRRPVVNPLFGVRAGEPPPLLTTVPCRISSSDLVLALLFAPISLASPLTGEAAGLSLSAGQLSPRAAMTRGLSGMFLYVLIGLSGPAAAQEPLAVSPEALCAAANLAGVTLERADAQTCRALWRRRIEQARERVLARRALAIEEQQRLALEEKQRATSGLAGGPARVTVERFLNESLVYGDVVVTSQGPRVYVGDPGRVISADDFIPLGDPRSPHRKRAGQFAGTHPR